MKLAEGENFLPNFDVPDGFTLDGYFEHVVRAGFAVRGHLSEREGRER